MNTIKFTLPNIVFDNETVQQKLKAANIPYEITCDNWKFVIKVASHYAEQVKNLIGC